MNISRSGIDLAKNVFQLHGVDRHGKMVWKRQLKRDQWLRVLLDKTDPSCVIGMEACGGAHHSIDKKLFFAGEAVARTNGPCNGAYSSGVL